MSLGTNYYPTVPVVGAASYKLIPVFTLVMVIGKCTDVFTGIFLFFLWGGEGEVEGGYVGGSFHEGICHGGRAFQ